MREEQPSSRMKIDCFACNPRCKWWPATDAWKTIDPRGVWRGKS